MNQYKIKYHLDNGPEMLGASKSVRLGFTSLVKNKRQKRKYQWYLIYYKPRTGYTCYKKIAAKAALKYFRKCPERLEVKIAITKDYLFWM